MATFDEMETSVEDGAPVEIYTFALPSTTYRLTSAPEDVTVGAETYTAIPISRGNAEGVPLGEAREQVIAIPVNHPLAAALIGNGIPPRDALVTIERYHPGTSARRLWRGFVAQCDTSGEVALVTVPNKTDREFLVRLPIAISQRTCNHELYDHGCGISRNYGTFANHEFMSACLVSSVNGTMITLNVLNGPTSAPRPSQWARYGEVVRRADGERRSILSQPGTAIDVDVPFAALEVGDELEVYAGCDHTIDGEHGCLNKFNNVRAFFGHPQLPNSNPHAPTGHGVIVQV